MPVNSTASGELLSIERKMIEALNSSFDHWKTAGGGVVPPSLVKLMSETHACIRERIKRQFGVDTSNVSWREMLVELEQLRQQALEMLALEEAEQEQLQ